MKLFALIGALLAVAVPSVALAQDTVKTAPKAEGPTVCTVNGKVIADPAKAGGKAEYKGKTYYFCCGNCEAKFKGADDAGKAKLAKVSDLRVEKLKLQKKLDAVDAELKTLTEEAKPVAAAPKVVYCAVTDEEIGTPDKASSTVSYNGKTYYLCCPGCKPKFDAEPAKYAAEADKKAAERAAKH